MLCRTASSFSPGNRQHRHPLLVMPLPPPSHQNCAGAGCSTCHLGLQSVLWLQDPGVRDPNCEMWHSASTRQQHAASLSLHQGRQGRIYMFCFQKYFMFWFQKYFTSSESEDAECLRDVWITPSISAESWWDMRSVTELRTQRLRICRISEFAEHINISCDTVAVPAQNPRGGCHGVRGQQTG